MALTTAKNAKATGKPKQMTADCPDGLTAGVEVIVVCKPEHKPPKH